MKKSIRLTDAALVTVGGLSLGFGAMRANDLTFLIVYTAIAGACISAVVWRSRNLHTIWRSLGLAAIAISSLWLILAQNKSIEQAELENDFGLLEPDNLPAPKDSCNLPSGLFTVHLGSNVMVGNEKYFHNLGVIAIRNKRLLSISRVGYNIAVTASIFDDRHNLVAKLEDNRFQRNNYASYIERPSKSRLIVYDHGDNAVLDVHFVNPQTFLIKSAIMFAPDGGPPLVVTELEAVMEPQHLRNNCGSPLNSAGVLFSS